MNSERSSSLHAVSAPRAQVIGLDELRGDAVDASARPVLADDNPLHAVRARLQVVVGEVELTVGELLAAREHQVFALNRLVDQPVDLLLEGKVVARGQLVALEGHFAVQITELPVPLKP